VGAPWLDAAELTRLCRRGAEDNGLEGAAFRAATFEPRFQKFGGTPCNGVEITVTNADRLESFLLGMVVLEAALRHVFERASVAREGAVLGAALELHPDFFRWRDLRAALDAVQADPSVRVLVLTGAGRGFCAGQDLADPAARFVPGQTPPDLGDLVEQHYKPLVMRLKNLRVPTIAAVNGIAAGAGASVALACDIVVAARSASFLQAFSKIGLIPDTGGTWLLPQRVGTARAMGLALLADKLPAEQAAAWGLIWAAYADEEFAAQVEALAERLAAMPTKALVRTRQLMQAAPTHTFEQQLEMEGGFMRELGRSADYVEGVSAFMEKRAPRFTGA
jgi:2-(1,2-epoxy-1,2-dihydrophenyl)acetyl-CoA isomerase